MRVLLQRVSHAAVEVDGAVVGKIGLGVLLMLGFGAGDGTGQIKEIATKISQLRIFPDERGRFHHSLLEVKGGALLIPQFTLFADCSKGRRPEFFGALHPAESKPLFEQSADIFRETGITSVESGVFGADMKVSLLNDGPVTIWLDSTAE